MRRPMTSFERGLDQIAILHVFEFSPCMYTCACKRIKLSLLLASSAHMNFILNRSLSFLMVLMHIVEIWVICSCMAEEEITIRISPGFTQFLHLLLIMHYRQRQ